MGEVHEFRLDHVPRRRETLEHEGILIEWDFPKQDRPVVVFKPAVSWYRRLAPLKATPNRRARVLRDIQSDQILRGRLLRMRTSLRERDPQSKWKIEQQKDDDGTYSVFVTYQGVMTDAERQERDAKVALHSRQSKLRKIAAEQRRALKRSTLLNPSLRPPVVGPED